MQASGRKAATTEAIKTPRQVKVLLLGNTCVGKTSLVQRFCDDTFGNTSPTIGIEFQSRKVSINGEEVKVQVFNSTGLERLQSASFGYYPLAACVALTYSVTDRASFDDVRKWSQRLEEHGDSRACHLLIANKADLETDREVSEDEGRALARELGLSFFETSAKTGQNVEAALLSMAITAELRMEELSGEERCSSNPSSFGHVARLPSASSNSYRHSSL